MSLTSMTGFARVEGSLAEARWSWELKSVNGRGLDVRFRLPPGFDSLEMPARKIVNADLARGQVTANLQYRGGERGQAINVNSELLTQYSELARDLANNSGAAPARADGLLALRGVLESQEVEDAGTDTVARDQAIIADLKQALAGLCDMRRQEGAALQKVLLDQVATIARLTQQARAMDVAQPAAIKARLREKIEALLEQENALPEERLAHEVSMLALKADIREELDRLDAHVASAGELLRQSGAVGRKLDFLAQEFNREANTVCSKSADVVLTNLGLELKSVIDQLREQVQNVE